MSAKLTLGDRDDRGRFLERLGLYLLLGPPVAASTLLAIGFLTRGYTVSEAFEALPLTAAVMYLVALPVAGLYAILISLVLMKSSSVSVRHVALCSLIVGAVLYLPTLIAMTPSEGGTVRMYWFGFIIAFAPVFVAGLACRLALPSLHRRSG
jgi:hypothetical protein